MQKDTVLATLQQMVEPLKEGLMHDSEVVLHDLTKLPNSIVAIAGSLTGRKVGGPATDLLLSKVAEGRLESEAAYQSRLPDGRLLRSTTIVVRDDAGVPVDLMRKQHKVEVVRLLKARGFFSLREAVERAAEELRVSRFSVYNYLNEIEEAEQLPEETVEA